MSTPARLTVVAAVVCIWSSAATANDRGLPRDDPKSPGAVEQPLRFIRVYSPADKPELWPRGQGRYLPLDSQAFERLIKAAGRSVADSSIPKANVAQAQYQASLDDDENLLATARLQVVNQVGKPLLLPLEPCSLAISRPRWAQDVSDSGKQESAATIGTDKSGLTTLLVERSGELLFDCTLHGKKTHKNGNASDVPDKTGSLGDTATKDTDIEFNLELPKCATNVLLLDLPQYFTPQVGHGIVVPVDEPSNKPSAQPPTTAGLKRWRIDLGGRNRSMLRLSRNDTARDPSQPVRLKQSLVYDFAERGLEVSSDFRLDISSAEINRVELMVDSPLRVIRAQCGDKPIDWSEMSATSGKTGRVSLELPQPIRGTGRSVQVWAYGPLVTDRTWRLPRIQAISVESKNVSSKTQKIFWEQGKATLLVSDPLQLLDIKADESRLSKTGRLPFPGSGESLQLQLFSANARPQVLLSRAKSQPLVDLGIATRLDAGDMTAQVTAKLQSKRQEQFQVEAALAAKWIVDSVQSQPPEVLADWRVRSGGNGSRRLSIRLARPLSPKRGTLRLIVGLRHPNSPLGRKLSIDDLVPLAFVNCEQGKSLLAIHAVQPHQLKTWGKASLSLAKADSLDADNLDLFAQTPQGLVVSAGEAGESLRILLQRQRPSYEAEIRAEARVEGDLLLESYQIRCRPLSSRVDRVLIHFSRVRPSVPRWRLVSEDNQRIAARRLPAAEEAAAGLDGEGETWEISLRQPRNEPFDIGASRTTKIDAETAVCLAALPEASQQEATLLILANDAGGGRFKNHRLEPIPPQPIDVDTYSPVRAAYRYNPLRTVSASEQAELTILPDTTGKTDDTADNTRENASESPFSPAWAWTSQLDSWHNPDGTARHSARYLIENSGRKRLTFTLPENIQLDDVHGIWVNERPVTWHTTVNEDIHYLSVDLPAQKRFPVVTIHFSTVNSRLGVAETLRPVIPEADIPTLWRYWTVWLAPGYAPLVGDHDTIHGYAPPVSRPSLTQRILGPLGRSAHGKTFDPFMAKAWKNAAAKLFDLSQNRQATELLLERIGRLARQIPADDRAWGSILGNESFGAVGRPLMIEADAFAQAGISPTALDAGSQLSPPPQLPPAPMPPNLESTLPAMQDSASSETTAGANGISNEEGMTRAIRLLRRSGMAVLVHDDAIVLTTSVRAAVYANYLKPCGGEIVWRVCPGPLSDWISSAADTRDSNMQSSNLIPASRWAASLDKRKSPWPTGASAALLAADTPGWTAVQLAISGDDNLGLAIVHVHTLEIFRWTAFILAIAIACWKGADKPLRLGMGLAVSATLALMMPIIVATVASGVCLGLLFCLLLRLIRRQPVSVDSNSAITKAEPSPSRSTAANVGPGIVLVLAMLSPGILTAQTPKLDNTQSALSADRSKTYRVLVPSNEKREPIGGRIFIPEEFYRQLHLRAAKSTGRPQGWLLTSATYRGTLVRKGQPERLSIDTLQAVFDLRLFDREARVDIPLEKRNVSIITSACLLDGRPVQPTWSGDGRSLVVPVKQAGRHRLELALKPITKQTPAENDTANDKAKTAAGKTDNGDGRNTQNKNDTLRDTGGELDIAIPRLNNAQLELILPAVQREIEVTSARGPVKIQNGLLTAELGGSDRLGIRWLDGTIHSVAKPTIKAEELLWLNIRPGSVVLEAKFSIKVDSGSINTLALEADPRLRLLEQGKTAKIVEVPGKSHSRQIQLAQPCTDEVVLTARFLLRDASGVGNVRPPLLRLANVPSATRRLAVSIAANLESTSLDVKKQNQQSPKPGDISDFMTAWGSNDNKPQAVFTTTDNDPDWSISAHPRRPPIELVQTLAVTFSQKRSEVRLDAKLTDTPGYGFIYRMATPSEVIIDKVSLVEEGVERVSRWSRADDGTLSIFLTGPAAVERNLSLQGHIKTPPQGKINIPFFHFEDGRAGSTRVILLRDQSVLVSVVKSSGLIESDWPSTAKSTDDSGDGKRLVPPRPVKSFIANGIQPLELQIGLSANIAKTKMVQSTILAPSGDASGNSWTATADLQIAVSAGLLDEVVLDVSDDFAGPYQLRQPGTIKVVEAADRRRRLVVRPQSPISGRGRLTLSGPLSSEPVSAPRITPNGGGTLSQILILPNRKGSEPINWETRGLKKTSLPDNYEVVDSRFRAVLVSSRKGQGNAGVKLADMNIAWRADGTAGGTATFDLLPDGRSWCPLWVPDNYQLIETRLDNVLAVPVADNDSPAAESDSAAAVPRWRKYRIQLASRTLPQRIELVFRGRPASNQWRQKQPWNTPRLGDLPVEKSLWRVCGPRQFAPTQPATPADLLRHEMMRLENTSSVIAGGLALPNRKADELLNWYRPWARRCAARQHDVRRTAASVDQLDLARSAGDLLKRVDEQRREIAKELQAEDILDLHSAATPVAVDSNTLWDTTLASHEPAAMLVVDAQSSAITADDTIGDLSFYPLRTSDAWNRFYAVLAIIAAIGIALRGLPGDLASMTARRWPHLLGVIAGLLWWLFLNPSIFGLIIVAVCLIASVRPGWQDEPHGDSMVVHIN